ncbi:hypothetical protein BCR39DRAFT_558424 [Naematelia encephala]|uniref:Chromo domain-containing protein n=1 Tax=Naematelia encephala TaxID=71784 RepID=A0A1Y2B8B3_9TREE|nr:hypothetical protein BCR39DRAFT_558424 [Naematelia encephala]
MPTSTHSNESETHTVKKIVAYKVGEAGQDLWKVLWWNYGHKDDTWEPISQFNPPYHHIHIFHLKSSIPLPSSVTSTIPRDQELIEYDFSSDEEWDSEIVMEKEFWRKRRLQRKEEKKPKVLKGLVDYSSSEEEEEKVDPKEELKQKKRQLNSKLVLVKQYLEDVDRGKKHRKIVKAYQREMKQWEAWEAERDGLMAQLAQLK